MNTTEPSYGLTPAILVQKSYEAFIASKGINNAQFSANAAYAKEFISQLAEQYSVKTSGVGSWLRANATAAGSRALRAAAGGFVVLAIAAQISQANAAAPRLIDDLHDYQADLRRTDISQAYADLDAVNAAIHTQQITGDHLSSLYVLGALLGGNDGN